MMCWFLTDKFIACWLQIYFYKIDTDVNHVHWCFVFCLPISSQIKKSADSLLTRFFPKPRATVFLLCLFSLFIVVSASRILWELPDPQPKFYMTSQPTQLPLTVRWYWNSVQAMGLQFFFLCPKHCAIGVVACSTVFPVIDLLLFLFV